MTFGYVPRPFAEHWDAASRLLDAAVAKGGNDWREVIRALDTGRAQLWLTIKDRPVAAMITRMDGDTLEIWLAGGAVLSGSVPFLETTIEAAKVNGATNGRITGRKGWERVLRPYGWQPRGDDLVKDFGHG